MVCVREKAKIELIESPEEIEKFDKGSWSIFHNSNLIIRPGSITKVTSEAYWAWGIKLTEKNREWLKKHAETFYIKNLLVGAPYFKAERMDRLVTTPFRALVEDEMARAMGNIAKEILKALDDGKRLFKICDIGAHTGGVTTTLIGILRDCYEKVIDRCKFYLVETSPEKMKHAGDNLEMFGVKNRSLAIENDEPYLAEKPDKTFDIVLSLSYFHHKPFSDHLKEIRRTLKDDGALIIGDWHSPLSQHPIHIYDLLKQLDAPDEILDSFVKYFRLDLLEEEKVINSLSQAEQKALEDHKEHWLEVADIMRRKEWRGKRPRLWLLDAKDTSAQRIKKLNDAGFETDLDKIKSAFPAAKLRELPRRILKNSDFAVVMAAIKKKDCISG